MQHSFIQYNPEKAVFVLTIAQVKIGFFFKIKLVTIYNNRNLYEALVTLRRNYRDNITGMKIKFVYNSKSVIKN